MIAENSGSVLTNYIRIAADALIKIVFLKGVRHIGRP